MLIALSFACAKEKETSKQQYSLSNESITDNISLDSSSKVNSDTIPLKYKVFKNMKSFDVDVLPTFDSLLSIKIDKEVYQKLFGKDVISNPEPLIGDFLLSHQNRNNGLREEIILTGTRFYTTVIAYTIYDKENNVKTVFELARSGGDMGYFEKSYGYFQNDTIYCKTTVTGKPHINKLSNEPDLTKPPITDTVKSTFLISKTGAVSKLK